MTLVVVQVPPPLGAAVQEFEPVQGAHAAPPAPPQPQSHSPPQLRLAI